MPVVSSQAEPEKLTRRHAMKVALWLGRSVEELSWLGQQVEKMVVEAGIVLRDTFTPADPPNQSVKISRNLKCPAAR